MGALSLLLLGLCVWKLIPAYQQLRLVWISRSWPSVQGKIVSGVIREESYTTETEKGDQTSTYYRPEFEFRYVVDNTTYTSSQRVFGDSPKYEKREKAQDDLKKYPKAGPVQVYYDPNDPSNGVLEPHYIGSVVRGFFLGFFMFSLAWFCFRITIAIMGLD
jgi:hypothetical protein